MTFFLVAAGFVAMDGIGLALILTPCGLPYLVFAAQAKRSWIEYQPGIAFRVGIAPVGWWRSVKASVVRAGEYKIDALGAFIGVSIDQYRIKKVGSERVIVASSLLFRRRDWKPFAAALEEGAIAD